MIVMIAYDFLVIVTLDVSLISRSSYKEKRRFLWSLW